MNGSGRRRMVLTKLNMAVLAPMPSARVSTATAVKPGFFSNCRKANFKSVIFSIYDLRFGQSSAAQIPNPKPAAASPPWSFELGASLLFGVWFLEFSFASHVSRFNATTLQRFNGDLLAAHRTGTCLKESPGRRLADPPGLQWRSPKCGRA